jgi:alkylated DNA repair dioxygenase AlkB
MGRHGAQPKLFDIGTELPNGFIYRPDFLTEAEEDVLLATIENLELVHPIYEGEYQAKRCVKAFGWQYDFKNRKMIPGPQLPRFLQGAQRKIAKWLDIPACRVGHALITEYQPGTSIGWHVDTEEFEHVIGISLAGWCSMRLRPAPRFKKGERRKGSEVMGIDLEQRSAYIMQGAARWDFQHSVAPTKTLRYSITFRTIPLF